MSPPRSITSDAIIAVEHYKFLRLDGDTPSAQRQQDMDDFNKPGSDIFIYMLSTRAGGKS